MSTNIQSTPVFQTQSLPVLGDRTYSAQTIYNLGRGLTKKQNVTRVPQILAPLNFELAAINHQHLQQLALNLKIINSKVSLILANQANLKG